MFGPARRVRLLVEYTCTITNSKQLLAIRFRDIDNKQYHFKWVMHYNSRNTLKQPDSWVDIMAMVSPHLLVVGSQSEASCQCLKNGLCYDCCPHSFCCCCLFLFKLSQEPSVLGTLGADFEPIVGQLSHWIIIEPVDVFLCILLYGGFSPFLLKIFQKNPEIWRPPFKALWTACFMIAVFKEKSFDASLSLYGFFSDMASGMAMWLLFVIPFNTLSLSLCSCVFFSIAPFLDFGLTFNRLLEFKMWLYSPNTGEVLLLLNWSLPSMEISSGGSLDKASLFSIRLLIMPPKLGDNVLNAAAEPKPRIMRAILGLMLTTDDPSQPPFLYGAAKGNYLPAHLCSFSLITEDLEWPRIMFSIFIWHKFARVGEISNNIYIYFCYLCVPRTVLV